MKTHAAAVFGGLVPIWMLVAALSPARAAAELVLKDGQTLSGVSLELRGEVYVLETGPDSRISIPWQLVRQVRLTGDDTPAPTGVRPTKAQQLAGPPDPPHTPGYREQLAAFGRPPAQFQRSPIPSRWRPAESRGPDVTEFNPSRWYDAPLDPIWRPESAYSAAKDVTHFSPARWYRSPVSSEWRPRDAFAPTPWFPPVTPVPE